MKKMGILSLYSFVFFALSTLTALASPTVQLTFPNCFPGCDEEDKKTLLQDGATEQKVIEAINAAQKEIRFSIYTFSRRPIFEALLRAHSERGVLIKGLVDRAQLQNLNPYCDGSICKLETLLPEIDLKGKPLGERLASIGKLDLYKKATLVGKLQLLSYQNENTLQIKVGSGQSRLMHNKFLIVDDRHVQTSSGNWSSTAMSVNFENTIVFEAPESSREIAAFTCAFDAIWSPLDGEPTSHALTRCGVKERIYFTPTLRAADDIESTIRQHIGAAQSSIAISMHHLEHPQVYEDLSQAVQRGVHVRLLFDDDDCLVKESPSIKKLSHLSASKVEVHYLPTNCALNQLSHNRFGIFDEHTVINGSANWSKAGLGSNYETFVKFSDAASVTEFRGYFDRLFEASRKRSVCGCDPKLEECRRQFCIGEFRPKFGP